MKQKIKMFLTVAAAGVLGAVLSWALLRDGSSAEVGSGKTVRRVVVARKGASVKKITEIRLSDGNGRKSVRITESEAARPDLMAGVKGDEAEAGAEDEERLTDLEKSVVKELQAALDANNLRAVRRILSKFTASTSSGGLGGKVHRRLRLQAVQALGWFGKDAALDLMEYVADADEEVRTDAFSQFELALQDVEMGDRERAEILKGAMKVLKDDDQLESLLNNLTDMRNSRRVETIKDIIANGTPEAKAKMLEQMEFYTDSDVTTVDALDRWLATNPDDPGDDDLYGGAKKE